MKQLPNTFTTRSFAFLASPFFFRCVLGLFVLEAGWIALSGLYPMAFDEEFHLGIIRLYAHHLSPFWNSHPVDGDAFGAVTRDPSYLYHYLMSFPYRFISIFSSDQTIQVIFLRFLNIGFFAWGLTLYRRLLLKTGASKGLVHASLLVFILVPVVPFLASQINYDNLLLPLTAWSFILAVSCIEHMKPRQLDARLLISFSILALLTSIVKYPFLPLLLGMVICIVYKLWKTYKNPAVAWKQFYKSWLTIGRKAKVVLLGGLFISMVLFGERDGINVIRYHTPVPDCAQVLSYQHCQHYGPWIRDYNFALNKPANSSRSPLSFTTSWFQGMWLRSYFTLAGPTLNYQTRGPFPIPAQSAIVFTVFGGAAVLITAPRLLRRYDKRVLAIIMVSGGLYVLALWVDTYRLFLHAGKPVAINGRYLVPVLPFAVVLTALASKELLRARRGLQLGLLSGVMICGLWGGGALTYILRSNDAWYFPAQPVYDANHAVQKILKPVTPGSSHPTEFLH